MLIEDFLLHIESQFASQLPFVGYRKPNETFIKAIFQKDNKVFTVTDFTESGFVFSPFDAKQESILFPSEICETITSEGLLTSEKQEQKTHISINENSRQQHIELVQKGIDSITTNNLKKVVLSRVESVPFSEENPIHIFKSLLENYKNAFVYIWYHPKVGLWLGATPETLIDIEGQRFKTMALAGTQTFVGSMEVEWDKKNIEEQQVVTDFIESKLRPFSEDLKVTPAKTIKAGKLLHLQSLVSGILKTRGVKDIIQSLHPTPAVCGLPQEESKVFILEHENYNREFYTGFLGELNIKTSKTRNPNRRNVENNAYTTVKTTSELYVNLRCMQIKNQEALIYVGGGITRSSNPELEWEETVNKSQIMSSVLN